MGMKFLETLNKHTSALPLAPGFSHDDVTGIAAKAVRFFSVSDPAENKSPEESDVVPAPSFSMAFSKRDLRPIQALDGDRKYCMMLCDPYDYEAIAASRLMFMLLRAVTGKDPYALDKTRGEIFLALTGCR